MTDQTIPADKVEKIATAMRAAMRRDEHAYPEAKFLADLSGYIKDLESLLPAPPRPTLADMTLDEQDECTGMQADLAQGDRVVILDGTPDAAGLVQVLEKSLDVYRAYPKEVTPRPDLPPLPWPGTEKPAPAPALPDGWQLADHEDHGRVIVTNPTPDSGGYVYFVAPATSLIGNDWHSCTPAELTFLDQDADTPTGPNHLAVGTVIESADDPRIDALPVGSILLDREGEVVTNRSVAWTGPGYPPIPSEDGTFGPWTVLHIPKETDQ